MLSTRLMTTSSRSSIPANRTRPSNGKSSSAGSTICSRWPLRPAPAKRASAALTASSGDRKSPIRTNWPARGSGSKAGRLPALGPLADQLDDPRQGDPSADWRHAASEQRQPLAAAHQQARQCHEQQFGAIALGRPIGAGNIPSRAVVHRSRRVTPQPYALRSFPFGFTDVEALGLGALAPIDPARSVTGRILPELPEGLPLPDAATPVHALRHVGGDAFRRDQQRRQPRRSLLGAIAQGGGRRPLAREQRGKRSRRGRIHRNGAEICSMT